jgi:hypothetical protein
MEFYWRRDKAWPYAEARLALISSPDGAEPVTAATAGQINIPESGAGSREGRGDVLPAGCINYADLKGKPDLPGLRVRNLA